MRDSVAACLVATIVVTHFWLGLSPCKDTPILNDTPILYNGIRTKSEYQEVHQNNNTGLNPAKACTAVQRGEISKSLDIGAKGGGISELTRCPEPTWINDFYGERIISSESFLGISVGCNKGHDAIRTARMGMSDLDFDGPAWGAAMKSAGLPVSVTACGADTSTQVDIKTKRDGEMHCIEPMPETFQSLMIASGQLNMSKKNFFITNAAISSTNGIARFPIGGKAGIEYFGIDACEKSNSKWASVPMYTLETYVDKFVAGKGPVNILQIDVEGFDFNVLFGASSVLDRTHYLEFEYNGNGDWGRLHVQDAVKLLDTKGFTCYWSGKAKLWQITECYFEEYDRLHDWSNVACVHRNEVPVLSNKMEEVFLSTIS